MIFLYIIIGGITILCLLSIYCCFSLSSKLSRAEEKYRQSQEK